MNTARPPVKPSPLKIDNLAEVSDANNKLVPNAMHTDDVVPPLQRDRTAVGDGMSFETQSPVVSDDRDDADDSQHGDVGSDNEFTELVQRHTPSGHCSDKLCVDAEDCASCGVRDCPDGELLHYHHDGCPSCVIPERPHAHPAQP